MYCNNIFLHLLPPNVLIMKNSLIWMTRDPLGMRGSNGPGNLQKDYDKIKIVNMMHKGLALSKHFFLDDAIFETRRNMSAQTARKNGEFTQFEL